MKKLNGRWKWKDSEDLRNDQEKEVFAYIFFLDLTGFGSFLRRCSHYETEVLPFRRAWRRSINDFEMQTKWFAKPLGDGVLLIWETDRNDTDVTAPEALNQVHRLIERWKHLIAAKTSPRPDGVRTAGTFGSIWKEPSKRFGYDYFGDKINLCEKMTHQHRGKSFLVHESLKELVKPAYRRRNGFSFTRLDRDNTVYVHPVYLTDMEELFFVLKKKTK